MRDCLRRGKARAPRVSASSLPASIASSYFEGCEEPVLGQIDAARSARSKHARQRTGRPCVGKNGTIVGLPHSAQMTLVSERPRTFPNLALHFLQCLGSCRNCFSLKNICSPALKINSSAQMTHFKVLSLKSIAGRPSNQVARRAFRPAFAVYFRLVGRKVRPVT